MSMRGKMFEMFTEKELSTDMMHLITEPMKNFTDQQKEARASRIVTIANTCKTEQEIMQKLRGQNLV